MQSRSHRRVVTLLAFGLLVAACGEPADNPSAVDEPTAEEPAEVEPTEEPPAEEEPTEETDAPEEEPECGFLECVDGPPPGVEGSISSLTPGPSCPPAGPLTVSVESAVQGDKLVICLPDVVSLDDPSTLTITGPSGVVRSDEIIDRVLRSVGVSVIPDQFPVGDYEINIFQAAPAPVDETIDFAIGLATSPKLLVDEISPSTITVWVSGDTADSVADVDYYVFMPDGGCVYRGSSAIPTDENGVGSDQYLIGNLEPGGYYAFLRSVAFRVCNFPNSDFMVP